MVVWEWFHEHPIVDVHLFKDLNFTSSNLMLLMLGVVYFSSLVMMPRFLQTLVGYTGEKAGLVLSASGVLLLAMLPVVGRLTSLFQARHLVAQAGRWLPLRCSSRRSGSTSRSASRRRAG